MKAKLTTKLNLILVVLGVSAVVASSALLMFRLSTESDTGVSDSALTGTTFIDYDTYIASQEEFTSKRIVYFFHANWCPTCKALEKSIKAGIGSIPEDLVIVKVNFDDSKELREEYGVVVQHTLVQIRDDGSIIGKWVGQPTLAQLLQAVQAG